MWTTSTRLFWTTSAFIVAHMTTSVAFICYRLYNLGRIFIYSDIPGRTVSHSFEQTSCTPSIGLYRDVWIAAIASSRTSLATLIRLMHESAIGGHDQWLPRCRSNIGIGNEIVGSFLLVLNSMALYAIWNKLCNLISE